MAVLKNTNDLLSQAATNLPDNTSQEISPQDIREMAENTAFSSYNKVSDEPLVGLKEYSEAVTYGANQGAIFGGVIYVSNKVPAPGVFNPADWDASGGSVTAGAGIIKTGDELRLGNHYLAVASTGAYDGAILSVGLTTGTFSLTAGEGFYIDSNTDFSLVKDNVQGVTISARTDEPVTNILTQPVTYILVDKDDNIIQNTSFPTPQERRDYIFIGVVVHSDNINVNVVNNLQVTANDVAAQMGDVMEALGFFNLNGNIIHPNGANLSINKSVGTAFKRGANYENNKKDPHTLSLPLQTLATFRYRNQDSGEGLDVTVIDPTTYDLSGVTTTVPANNNATIQRVYILPSGAIRIQRGQEVFTNFSSAVDSIGKESFLTEPNIAANGLLLASIVMKKTATSLQDETKVQIFIASRFGELGSVGSSSTTNLQQAYDNSTNPEIITSASGLALTMRQGSGADTDLIYEGQNGAGSTTFSVDGNGLIQGDGSALTGVGGDTIFTGGTFTGNSLLDLDGNNLTFENGGNVVINNTLIDPQGYILNTTLGNNLINLSNGTGSRKLDATGNSINITFDDFVFQYNTTSSNFFKISAGLNTTWALSNFAHHRVNPNGKSFFNASANSNKAVIFGDTDVIGTELVSLRGGATAIQGAGTSTGTTLALYDNDTTPNKTWEWLDNGDVVLGSLKTWTEISYTGVSHPYLKNTGSGGAFWIAELSNDREGAFAVRAGSYNSKFASYGSNLAVNSDRRNKTILEGAYNHGEFVILNNASSNNAEIWLSISNNTQGDATEAKRKVLVTNNDVSIHNADFIVNPSNTGTPAKIGSEEISLQGDVLMNANVNIPNLPTSSTGLSSGDLWNDGGTLKIA